MNQFPGFVPRMAEESEKKPALRASNRRRSMLPQRSTSIPTSTRPQASLERPSIAMSTRASHPRQSSLRGPKPPFSAMQQHFSPRKKSVSAVPQELESSELHPSLETKELKQMQVELLQLHLMHKSAYRIQYEWEHSAEVSLHGRFDDLRSRHEEIKEIAHQQKTLFNQIALAEWCQGISSSHIAEKVQQLSRNILDLGSLLDPQGRYTHVLDVFESWFASARHVEESRKLKHLDQKSQIAFVEGIGDGWKAEAMVLERELTYCLRDLKSFGDVRETSSLGRILSLHKHLASTLLSELDVIQWIENEKMEQESLWMEQIVNKLSSNVEEAL